MLLLNGECEPVTRTIAFLDCGCKALAEAIRSRQEHRPWWQGIAVSERELVGDLRTVLHGLLPLTDCEESDLLVPTTGCWTAWFDNGWLGGDQNSSIDRLARNIGCRAVRAVYEPERSTILDVHEADGTLRRSIYVCKDRRQCRYYTYGEPFEFEHSDCYSARRVQDRFTPEMLNDYLRQLGIDAYSAEFYTATASNPARLIVPRWRPLIYPLCVVGWFLGAKIRRFHTFEDARRAAEQHFAQAKRRARRSSKA